MAPQQDLSRRTKVGALLAHAPLCKVIGDWQMMKHVFRLPGHNETGGICWFCRACPATFKMANATAPWRTQRLNHWDVVSRIVASGNTISPLMTVPFFNVQRVMRIDWMHVCDLGVTADWLGQMLTWLMRKQPGRNITERLARLRDLIDAAYIRTSPDTRIDSITPGLLNLNGNAPKLLVHAAECRCMVPVGVDLATHQLDPTDPTENTIQAAMFALSACYDVLSRGDDRAPALVARECRRFCTLYVALEEVNPVFWVRPKLHLFQEMVEMLQGSSPSNNWTYRDEDFGGAAVQLARSRGGPNGAHNAGQRLLTKFSIRHRVPRL